MFFDGTTETIEQNRIYMNIRYMYIYISIYIRGESKGTNLSSNGLLAL